MPELSALGPKDLREVTQTMARAIYMAFEGLAVFPGVPDAAEVTKKDRHAALNMRVFRALYDSGAIKEVEFTGSGLNAERRGVIAEFKAYYDKALGIAKLYEECVAPVEEEAPNFAMPSHALVRMWCVAHFWKALSKAESPFANMQVEYGTGVHDEDETEESEDGEEDEDEDEEASGEESEESDESDEEGAVEEEEEEEAKGTDDDKDSSSSSGEEEEEEEEEEEKPNPAEETAEEYADRHKYKNPVPPDFGLTGFDAEYARYEAKRIAEANGASKPPKKRARDDK